MNESLDCFKAYDIRGRVPDQLNERVAYRIGQAYAAFVEPESVVVGHDMRLSSPALSAALARGLEDAGVAVLDIGMVGTEQVYFATDRLGAGGGIMVTASHNPADYNGMKLVREGSRPISGDTGLQDIRRLAEEGVTCRRDGGARQRVDILRDYLEQLLGYVDRSRLKPLQIVANAGNGAAGPVIDALSQQLPFEFIRLQFEPDGHFPNGVPNPLLPENRGPSIAAIKDSGADFGIAWDGDFDRCFLFDERGEFIEGYYIVGLLARSLLAVRPGEKIVHDPRLTWNTIDMVRSHGGTPVQSKTGHAFIKERMRKENALYGGEMSAHHYFRDFAYCDSGMIPWLLIAGIICDSGQTLSELVRERMALYPCSGEINRRVDEPAAAIAAIRAQYEPGALRVDETDGIGLEFENWRFNLRMSNTEPVIRLNVESRADEPLMRERTRQILAMLDERNRG